MLLTIALGMIIAPSTNYDPNRIDAGFQPKIIDLTLHDSKRARDVPVKFYLPSSTKAAPVVIFSHGLGGSREGNAFLGIHLAARGYVAVFTQHPGSDTSVWKGKPVRERMAAMQQAANFQNFNLRQQDIHFLLDELARMNQGDAKLKSRMDLDKVGMSGHSFGAVTTQAVSGQSYPGVGQSLTDKRVKAALAYSPSYGGDRSLSEVKIPWLLMTGTEDNSPIGNTDAASRQKVYPALPPGDKFEVVLYNAEHSAFTESALPGDRAARNPNHHRVMLGVTTAFWDAYLKRDKEAKAWLLGSGPRGIMESKDSWKHK